MWPIAKVLHLYAWQIELISSLTATCVAGDFGLKNDIPKIVSGDILHVDRREVVSEEGGDLSLTTNAAHSQRELILLRIDIMMIPNRRVRYLKREYILCVLKL